MTTDYFTATAHADVSVCSTAAATHLDRAVPVGMFVSEPQQRRTGGKVEDPHAEAEVSDQRVEVVRYHHEYGEGSLRLSLD